MRMAWALGQPELPMWRKVEGSRAGVMTRAMSQKGVRGALTVRAEGCERLFQINRAVVERAA